MDGQIAKREVKIVGVTFLNSDGSSRQQILEELDDEYGERLGLSEVELHRYQFKGEPAYRVTVDGRTVGNLAATLALKMSRLEDNGCEIWAEEPHIVGGKREFDDIFDGDDEDLNYGMRITLCVLDPRKPAAPEPALTNSMYCYKCGKPISAEAVVCPNCGCATKNYDAREHTGDVSSKSRLVALLLCIFLGGLGVHRFYVGKIGTGIVWLLTAGCFGIGWIIDIILIACGAMRDKDGYRLYYWE